MKHLFFKNLLLIGVIAAIYIIPLYAQQMEQIKSCNIISADSIMPLQTRANADGVPTQLPQINLLSPEAASIVQYANYPVDYCSGLPQIDIPLYEVQSGGISLPITLSYRSSGLKPGEKSGWVGTGWALDIEPGLVRTVGGLPDESQYGYLNSRIRNGSMSEEDTQNAGKGYADYESDKFYYKLLSQSGTFYLQRYSDSNADDKFITYPNDLLHIDGAFYQTFYLRDKNGYIYDFGGNDNYEYCTREFSDGNPYKVRWLCNSIQTPNGEKPFKFAYTRMENITPTLINDYYILEDSIRGNGLLEELPILTTPNGSYRVHPDGTFTQYRSNMSTRMAPRYTSNIGRKALLDIQFNGGNVHFTNDWNNLTYFEVTNAEGKLIRRVDFYITPYNYRTTFTKLDSLKISAPGCEDRVYRFTYYGCNDVPGTEAYRKVDFFGYYNGSKGDSIVPYVKLKSQYSTIRSFTTMTHSIGGPKDARDPKSKYAKMGMLAQTVSPEGVLTDFEYEPNLCVSLGSISGPDYIPDFIESGGLRISRIFKTDSDGKTERRTYVYYQDFVSSEGKPAGSGMKPGYSYRGALLPDGNAYMYEYQQITTDKYGSKRYSHIRRINSYPITTIVHPNGQSTFYNHVSEEIDKGSHKEINDFYYTIPPHLWITGTLGHERRPLFIPFDPNGGDNFLYYKLYKTEKFIDDRLVERKEYQHEKKEGKDVRKIGNCHIFPYYVWNNNQTNENGAYYVPGCWGLERGCSRLTKETISHYDDNGKEFKTTKVYDYDRPGIISGSTNTIHVAPTKITTTNNSGQKTTEEFRYPEDFEDGPNLGQDDLIASNRYATPLEHKVTENGNTLTTRHKYEKEIFTRKGENGEFESLGTYATDSYGRVIQTCKEGELPVCYLFGYNDQYVIAKIVNYNPDSLLPALGITWQQLSEYCTANRPPAEFLQKLNALRNTLPDCQIYTYTYEPLIGMTSMTAPDGMTTYYENDGFGRLLESYYYEDGKKVVLEKHDYNTPTNKNILR